MLHHGWITCINLDHLDSSLRTSRGGLPRQRCSRADVPSTTRGGRRLARRRLLLLGFALRKPRVVRDRLELHPRLVLEVLQHALQRRQPADEAAEVIGLLA